MRLAIGVILLLVVVGGSSQASVRKLLNRDELAAVEAIEKNSDYRFVNLSNDSGVPFYKFADSTGRIVDTARLEEFRQATSKAPKQNIVVITDLEPDDRIALEVLATRLGNRLKFVGVTVMNAFRKADLTKRQLRDSGLADLPVRVGAGGFGSNYPNIASSKAARKYEQEGQGILSDADLLHYSRLTSRSSESLVRQLERSLKNAVQFGEKLEIVLMAPPTDLILALESNPGLKAGISRIHVMGGWIEVQTENKMERRTTYNWNMDPLSSARLLALEDVAMTVYSSHIIKPNFAGGSISEGNFPELIAAIESSDSPRLQTFRKAGGSWDRHLMEKIPPLQKVIGANAGRQFTPADPLVAIGMINPALIESATPVSIRLNVNDLDPNRGYGVEVVENPLSKIQLVTKINVPIFQVEMLASLQSSDAKRLERQANLKVFRCEQLFRK